jgi:hypothetical protein
MATRERQIKDIFHRLGLNSRGVRKKWRSKHRPAWRQIRTLLKPWSPDIGRATPVEKVFMVKKEENGKIRVTHVTKNENLVRLEKPFHCLNLQQSCEVEMENDQQRLYWALEHGKVQKCSQAAYGARFHMDRCVLLCPEKKLALSLCNDRREKKAFKKELGNIMVITQRFRSSHLRTVRRQNKRLLRRTHSKVKNLLLHPNGEVKKTKKVKQKKEPKMEKKEIVPEKEEEDEYIHPPTPRVEDLPSQNCDALLTAHEKFMGLLKDVEL